MISNMGVQGKFVFKAYKNGLKLWEEVATNAWTDEGLQYLADRCFKGIIPSLLTYNMGIIDTGAVLASGDTMGSHVGWTENVTYDEATRVTWGQGDPSVTANVVTILGGVFFNMNINSQVLAGAFISSDNTKGGTSGTLFTTGLFDQGDKILDAGVVLSVTYTVTIGNV